MHVVWFKRDLRIEDHAPLAEAAARGPVLPLFIVEPNYWREPDVSHRQYAFLADCLRSLDAALQSRGSCLVLRTGDATAVLDAIHRMHGITALWSHEETGNLWTYQRDLAVAGWARARNIPWHELRQDGVVRRLHSRDGWARRWDRRMAQPVLAAPKHIDMPPHLGPETLPDAAALGLEDDGCVTRQPGGRDAALACLESFLSTRGRTYRTAMSSPDIGAHACSRLSPHLAWGTISLKEVTRAASSRLRTLQGETSPDARLWRGALVSFSGRLHWHCHFMQKLESEPLLEYRELHPSARGLRPAEPDERLLNAWADGATGYPFLDACMRSLRATGWLNFRMRAMVMSFASYNLWLPWRPTGLHLARMFTDYEPGIHWPQVQMQSGTTGINTIRIYNVVKQGYDQDPNGTFVRRWVPELAPVPDRFVQEPWSWQSAATVIGRSYPARIVDLGESTKAAKDRIYAMRRGSAFHEAADRIQERHGSRKSGIPMTGNRTPARKRKRAALDDNQLKLDV